MQKLLAQQLEAARLADGSIDIERLGALLAGPYEQLRESRKNLRTQNERFVAALEHMAHGLSMYDGNQRLVTCNRQFLELYRLPKRFGRIGTTFKQILEARVAANTQTGDDTLGSVEERLRFAEQRVAASSVLHLNSGQVISVTHQPLKDGGWVSTHKDITEFSQLQDELAHLAYHDAMTGLPNRHMLHRQISENFALVDGVGTFALLFADLDGFKSINDTLGHATGDQILKQVAERLLETVGEWGLAGRLGGDEFAVVMRPGASTRDAYHLAEQMTAAMRRPFMADGQSFDIGLSVGVAVAPGDGTNQDQLLKNADLALYAAKSRQRGGFCFYEPSMARALAERTQIEQDLSRALELGEFELHYQPIFSFKSRGFAGFEALLRWRRGGDTLVPPAQFIPVAEETGLIVRIGEWVLRQALAEAAQWPSDLSIAINVSSVQFQRGNIVPIVMNALAASGIAPKRVEIEITESVFFENTADNLDALRQLHALGIRIALDDFGTGFSALSYLLSYPFDKIKIDGSFVRALDSAKGAHAIVGAVAEIGRRMGMTTTAEGVETPEQLRNVHAAGYGEVQGYLVAQPMPAEQVRAMLAPENDLMPEVPFALRATG
ncbi:MAG: EAL domain-containing protein [Devosia sp.]